MQYKLRCGLVVEDVSPATFRHWLNARQSKPVHICTANPEMAEWYYSDPGYKATVDAADIRTIDGVGVALALYRQYGRSASRFTGVNLVNSLIEVAQDERRRVIIVGATPASRSIVEGQLRKRGIDVGEGCSPLVTDVGEVLSDGLSGDIPRNAIVLVALGIPKQERWIRRQIAAGAPPGCIFAGIGGVIDYLSGTATFAPAFLRRLGLEWLFRLVLEPRKRLKRQATTLPNFLYREILTRSTSAVSE
jgi:N-acetylglucosaminyldiphosphoundecaprenol N-acetyl-beta-D-mannosaminyltransferase